jgi:hypothetical protein
MTKKHFIDAAAIVRNILDGSWTNDPPAWAYPDRMLDAFDVEMGGLVPKCRYTRAVYTAEAFVTLFTQHNPRFDTQRFLIACGLAEKPAKGKVQ